MANGNVWFPANETKASSVRLPAPYLSVLELNNENNLLLGSNQLGGSIWHGSLWLFQKPEDAPDPGKSIAGIEMEVGSSDAKFLPSGSHFVAADYSNNLSLFDIKRAAEDCPVFITKESSFKSHDDYVTSIDVDSAGTSLLSASKDESAIQWDVENNLRKRGFTHASSVEGISLQPEQDHVFVTITQNGTSFIWDSRLEKPASLILDNNVPLTSVDWVTDTLVAVSDVSGHLFLIDTREKKTVATSQLSRGHGIRKLRAHRKSQLLACGVDDLSVRVLSCQGGKLFPVYEKSSHKDFVTGLTWKPDSTIVYSCGWDTAICCHDIPSISALHIQSEDKSETNKAW